MEGGSSRPWTRPTS